MADAVVIAAPSSGAGKTLVTLALLKALQSAGISVASAKVGPDYIDARYHAAATGRACYNLDLWAMPEAMISDHLETLSENADLIIIEGVMGLYDGPESGQGSTADLALHLNLPVILVVDCSHQGQSVAALVKGFAEFKPGLNLAGVLLNHLSSDRHRDLMTKAINNLGIEVVGAIRRVDDLMLPSRHLGLVQADEHPELPAFFEKAADLVSASVDLQRLRALAAPVVSSVSQAGLAPLGQRIAVAQDEAFGFNYAHLLEGWRRQGADIFPFSPLADEAPDDQADAVMLPGGYPELHAERLSVNTGFFSGLRNAARRGALIYGECGGYMVLGDYLIDRDGTRHAMAGLIPLGTSFAKRRLQLGYRHLKHLGPLPWPNLLKGHEFHYSTVDWQGPAEALFEASATAGASLGPIGLRAENVMGSYAHVIAPVAL